MFTKRSIKRKEEPRHPFRKEKIRNESSKNPLSPPFPLARVHFLLETSKEHPADNSD